MKQSGQTGLTFGPLSMQAAQAKAHAAQVQAKREDEAAVAWMAK